jgi:hypothetical protein
MSDVFAQSNEADKILSRQVIDLFEDGKTEAELALLFQIKPDKIYKILERYQYEEDAPPPVIMRDRLCNRCRRPCRLPQFIFTCDACKDTESYKELT